ncbi:MAG: hypothetical protein JWQ09_5980 [Segetibacter sp.]|nr:hypothetical protein [Segetibacter sp.]
MKKISILFFVLTVLYTTLTKAQDSKTTFGICFGGALTNITGKDSQGKFLDPDSKVGAHIGVNVEIPIVQDFYFQPGLLITNKGAKMEETVNTRTSTATTNLTYIEIPLNLLYKPKLGAGNLILGVGPYVAYAIHGQLKLDPGTNEKITFKNTVKNSDPTDGNYLKRFDAGASIVVGYPFKTRFSVQFNGQLGLTGIQPKFDGDPADKSSYKNSGFGISIGYRFYPKNK